MESKKDPRLDLERYSKLFLNIGFIVSLTVCLIAFEWKTYEDLSRVEEPITRIAMDTTLDMVFVKVKPPEPPKVLEPKPPKIDLTKDLAKINISDELIKEDKLPPSLEDMPDNIPPAVIAGTTSDVVPEEDTNLPIDIWALEKQPEGQEAFYQYISKNLKYPNTARSRNVEGKVFVQFVVNTDGSLTDIKVIKGIGAGCDEEAIRVIEKAPKWTPGRQRGKPVRVRMALPITFKLSR